MHEQPANINLATLIAEYAAWFGFLAICVSLWLLLVIFRNACHRFRLFTFSYGQLMYEGKAMRNVRANNQPLQGFKGILVHIICIRMLRIGCGFSF